MNTNSINTKVLNYCHNEITALGMMNKNCYLNYDMYNSYFKNKAKSKIVINNINKYNIYNIIDYIENNNFKNISLMYSDIDVKNDLKNNQYILDNYNISSYKEEQIVSVLNKSYFEGEDRFMEGKQFKELRPYIKRYNNIIKVKNIYQSKDDVIEMLNIWKQSVGKKYNIRCRSGVDKALVERYNKDKLGEILLGFAFYIYNKELNKDICIGYAITTRNLNEFVETQDHKFEPVFNYMCRKVLTDCGLRNITEYIDWYVFNKLYYQYTHIYPQQTADNIYINWGCSSGGVKWYKEHKWPLYQKEYKYFYNLSLKNKN